jgi:hypothetical protein
LTIVVVVLEFVQQVNDYYEWVLMVDLYLLLMMKQDFDDDLMVNDDHYLLH